MKDKYALVTGASSGIGKEISYLHAMSGGNLVIVARSEEKLKKIKDDIKSKFNVEVMVIKKDLTKEKAPFELYEEIKSKGIKIDYLINNAGFGGYGLFHQRKMEDDIGMIELNIISLTKLTKLFLQDFVKERKGKILNVSSTASLMPGPLQAIYFASKAFVTSFSYAISRELKGTGVTVTALLPGATATDFVEVANMEKTKLFSKLASARGVAKKGYEGMLKGKLKVVAGAPLSLRLKLVLVKFAPKKMVLNQVFNLQKKNKK